MQNFTALLTIAALLSKGLCTNLENCHLRQPQSHKRCGYPVHVHEDSPYAFSGDVSRLPSANACCAYCARRGYYCAGFAYDTRNGFCTLLNEPFDVTRVNKSTKYVFEKDCFDCGHRCDQTIGANLLDNGDFQSRLLGPWFTSHSRIVRADDGQSYYKADRQGKFDSGSLSQAWVSCSNFLYEVKWEYRFAPGGNASKFLYGFIGQETLSFEIDEDASAPSGEWTSTRFWVRGQPANTLYDKLALELAIQFNVAGTEMDNIGVSRFKDPPQTKIGAQSAIVNGDFESGDFEPWVAYFGAQDRNHTQLRIVSPGINSDYAVSMEGDSDALYQTFDTTPGTAYVFSFDYQLESGHVKLGYNLAQATYGIYQFEFTAHFNASDGALVDSFAIPFVANSNSTFLLLSPSVIGASFILDNFSFKELAE